MRATVFILLAAAAACPASAAPKLGQRTASPEQMLARFEAAGQAGLEQDIAAANAHPLGTRANPVRVGGPDGERAYLARLRCADGSAPAVGARGEGGVGAFGSLVGAYPLDCGGDASGPVSLLIDPYHQEHQEDRAPPGFLIGPR